MSIIDSTWAQDSLLDIAVDTGGTFTDVAVRRADGTLFVWKVPSTPSRPDDAVIDGTLSALHEVQATASQVSGFVHGTTVATNTVITRTGARVALVTTAGFADVLQIGYQARPSLYDARVAPTRPVVEAEDTFEVRERTLADGAIETAPNEADLDAIAAKIAASDIDVVVVGLLNAYANDTNELAVVEALRARLDGIPVFAATAVSPEMREYDRLSTATINGYVLPKISAYVQRLEKRVRGSGITAQPWIMQSNGGLVSPKTASEQSARTVLSGLAGGVVGAASWARALGLQNVVSFDIGGTSTDIALIRDGRPVETAVSDVDGLPLRLPAVDVHTIGAGGGSIVWLDSGDSLRVGPQSAGARPGPISYGHGGEDLTVTDAHVVLGRLGTELLGGRFHLDRPSAASAMTDLADQLDMDDDDLAEGVLRVINATMARGVRKVSVERGVHLEACHLMAFGGAGPLHAADLLRELGMKSAIIPPTPGIASAVGMLDAPIRHDFTTAVRASDDASFDSLDASFRALESLAAAELGAPATLEIARYVDARYVGQSYELTIPATGDFASQARSFDDAHEARYGFADPDASMEVTVARVVATVKTESAPVQLRIEEGGVPQPVDTRSIYEKGQRVTAAIYRREDFGAGSLVHGPAVVEQFDTTIYIASGMTGRVDGLGFMHIEEKK